LWSGDLVLLQPRSWVAGSAGDLDCSVPSLRHVDGCVIDFVGGRVTGVVDECDRSFKCNVEFWWSANACLGSQNAKIFRLI
jgi:hypothetical protein